MITVDFRHSVRVIATFDHILHPPQFNRTSFHQPLTPTISLQPTQREKIMRNQFLLVALICLSSVPCKAWEKKLRKKKNNAMALSTDDDDLFYVNPCTGSLSRDEYTGGPCPSDLGVGSSPTTSPTRIPTPPPTLPPTSDPTSLPTSLPTISPTASPTISPTAYPTISPTAYPTISPTASPTTMPTSAPTEKSNIIQCPDSECDFSSADNNNTIVVKFRYSVETTSNVTNITAYLPKLEDKLLEELADDLLQCTNVRTLLRKKRILNYRRHLEETEITGVCSDPTDTLDTSGKESLYIISDDTEKLTANPNVFNS